MQDKTGKKTASRMWFCFLLLFVVWIVSNTLISIVTSLVSPDLLALPWSSITINDIALYFLAMPAMLLASKSLPNVKEIPRKKMKMGFFKFIFIFLFVLGAMYIANFFTILGVKEFFFFIFQRKELTRPAVEQIVAQPGLLQAIFFGAVVPALGEEFIFRYWLRRKTRGSGDKIFIAISAVSFGLFHGNIDQAIYATVIGAVLAWVYVQTDNMVYPMLLHFMINMMGIAVLPWVFNSSGYAGTILVGLLMLVVMIMAIVVFFVFNGKIRRGFMPPAQNGWTKDTLFAPDPALAVPSVCEPPAQTPDVSSPATQEEVVPLNAVDILIGLSEISKKLQAADKAAAPALVSETLPTATSAQPAAAPVYPQQYAQQMQAYGANQYAQPAYPQQYAQQAQAYGANQYAQPAVPTYPQQYAQQAQAYGASQYAQPAVPAYPQQYAQQAQAYGANQYAQPAVPAYPQQYAQQAQAYGANQYAQPAVPAYPQQYAQQAQAYGANQYAQPAVPTYPQQYAQQAQAYGANQYAQPAVPAYPQQYAQQAQTYGASQYAQPAVPTYPQQYAQQAQAYGASQYAQPAVPAYPQQYAQQMQSYGANQYAQPAVPVYPRQYQQGWQNPMPPISTLTRKEKRTLKKRQAAARGSLKIAFLNPGAIVYILVVLLFIVLNFFLTTAPL